MDSKKYWDEVVPDWVKDAIRTGDVMTVKVDKDREIPVIGPFGEDSISLESLVAAYNKVNDTDYRLDLNALDEYL
jgi:hypothetical protein